MLNKFRNFVKKSPDRCVENWEINFEDLKQKVDNGATLLDVRSAQEYNEGHLYNAIQMADYEISTKYKMILPDKNKEIVIYCQNGGRGKKAYKKLKKLGYNNVYNLKGGLDNIILK